MNIAFFIRQFTERGTEVAIYDYAKYNEEILKILVILYVLPKKNNKN
jgi:hypothetical protein